MKTLRFLGAFLALVSVLSAQQQDNAVEIPISYYGEGVAGYPNVISFSFGLLGALTSASGNTAPFYSSVATGTMKPGMDYPINVTKTGFGGAVIAHFLTVPDYDILINGQRILTIGSGGSFSFTLRLEPRINDYTGALAGTRGGQCSNLQEDKPFWYIGLGTMRNGRFAGGVGFRQNSTIPTPGVPQTYLYQTSSLIYDSIDTSEVNVTRDGSGYLTSVQSREVKLVIGAYVPGGTQYDIVAHSLDASGVWQPFLTYTVKQYGTNGVQIIKTEGSSYRATALELVGSEWRYWNWRECSSTGAFTDATKRVVTAVSGSTRTMYYGDSNAVTTPVVKRTKTYTNLGWGDELSSVELGSAPETNRPLTSYTYYTTSTGTGWARQIQWMIEPTGRWTKYDYFNGATDTRSGLVQRIYRPWLNAPVLPSSATTGNCHVETYDYVANFDNTTTAPSSKVITVNGTAVAQTTWTYNWNAGTANTHTFTTTTQKDYASGSAFLTTTTQAYHPNDADTYFRMKPHSVTRPDGTRDSYAYYSGTWYPSTNTFTPGTGGDKLILCLHGQSGSATGGAWVTSWTVGSSVWTLNGLTLIPNLSTVSETVIDTRGRVAFKAENIFTGSAIERISGTQYAYTANNQLDYEKDIIRSVTGADVVVDYSYRADGLLDWKQDIDGSRTTYGYDGFLRNTTITTAADGSGSYPAKTQTFAYNLADFKATAQDCSCSSTAFEYEKTGRPMWRDDPKPGGGTLRTTYTYNSPLQTTIKLPTDAEQVTKLYLDGRVESETGTGQVATYHDYAVASYAVTHTTRNGTGTEYPWSDETRDGLGRVTQQRTPQVGWTTSLANKAVRKSSTYDPATGQLTKVETRDEASGLARLLPDHLYVYLDGASLSRHGLLLKEGDDLGSNGSLDAGLTDRITLYASSFYKDTWAYNGWIRQNLTQLYRTLNNSTEITTLADRRTRFTKFNAGSYYYGDGVPAWRQGVVLSDVTEFGPSDQTANGRWTVTWDYVDPGAGKHLRTRRVFPQGSGTALTYWKEGYLEAETSSSGASKTYAYNSEGLQTSVTHSGTGEVTSTNYYPGTKYVSSTTGNNGAGGTTTTTFTYSWSTTDKSHTVCATDSGGNTTYNEYDAKGLLWRTWGSGAEPSLNAYDAYGRRTSLTTYQDGTSGTTWGGFSTPAVTQWVYSTPTGLNTSKIYPGSATVSYTYNPLGQVKTRTWARGVVTNYDYFDGSATAGYVLTGELRRKWYSDSTPAVDFTYARFGALATVNQTGVTNRSFAYRSDLQRQSESFDSYFGSRTLTSTYDGSVPGRPTGHSFNGNVTVSTTLGYNGAGQIGSVQGVCSGSSTTFNVGYLAGSDWAQTITAGSFFSRTHYLATNRGVLDRALTQWSGATRGDFDSVFDSRGRRSELYRAGSVSIGAANRQYYNYADYDDSTDRNRLVSEWNDTDSLRWTIYDYDLAGNRNWQWEPQVYATWYTDDATNKYTAITGQRPEPGINHDTDGNLTQDGTWTYTWDGENRLKTMTRSGQTLTFTYDYMDRRIRKVVTGTDAKDRKYVWDGWKLVAETLGDGWTIQYSFVWGPDFSGSCSANAGGAGGLLGIYSPGAVMNYAVPDAMGNIVGYLDASGNVNARYEYNAYGMLRQQADPMTALPFGFASQYTDRETGLVYYGYRYYNGIHGRFINRDPIGESGGNNLYAFVGNDPVNRWDVLGLCWRAPFFGDNGPCIEINVGIEHGVTWRDPRWTSGTFTRPNLAFNDGWNRRWQIRDRIYAAQGAANSAFGPRVWNAFDPDDPKHKSSVGDWRVQLPDPNQYATYEEYIEAIIASQNPILRGRTEFGRTIEARHRWTREVARKQGKPGTIDEIREALILAAQAAWNAATYAATGTEWAEAAKVLEGCNSLGVINGWARRKWTECASEFGVGDPKCKKWEDNHLWLTRVWNHECGGR